MAAAPKEEITVEQILEKQPLTLKALFETVKDNLPDSRPLGNKYREKRPFEFDEKYFKGKRVLDIGCNNGWATFEIAKFDPKLVIGVEADKSLTFKAIKSL